MQTGSPRAAPSNLRVPGREKNWDRYVKNVELMAETPGFVALRDRILELARLLDGDRLLDIGAGTGLLTFSAAPRVATVIAVDASPAMCSYLEDKLTHLHLGNVLTLQASATALPLADESVDVVLSNYCFHHLSDEEKHRVLLETRRVLSPGGRLVFADMMFGFKLTDRRDRVVIKLLVKRILSHGFSGLLRLLKNGARIALGRWERPATVEWWHAALQDAGFTAVSVQHLEHEGGIGLAYKPARAD
jgi:ubiquinone/menaquinone biosynthesis C-methylase UbiE